MMGFRRSLLVLSAVVLLLGNNNELTSHGVAAFSLPPQHQLSTTSSWGQEIQRSIHHQKEPSSSSSSRTLLHLSFSSSSSSQRRLRNTSIAPRNNRPSLGLVKWGKFTGIVTSLSFVFHWAGQHNLLGLGPQSWNLVAIGYPALIGLAAFFHMAMFQRSGGSGDQIAQSMGGIPCNDPNSRIDVLLDQVFVRSGLPLSERPTTYRIPTAEPNAFAAGSRSKSVVAVTQGLMDRLNDDQLRAVLAHEVAHLRNRDTIQSVQLAAMIAALATARTVGSILMRGADRTARRSRRSDNNNNDNEQQQQRTDVFKGVGWILYGTGMVTAFLGSLLRFGSSRTAEYAADAFAKNIGIGEDLASALEIISSTNRASPQPRDSSQGLGLASGAYAHAYIDNPPNLESPFVNAFGLLRTHPTTKERVKKLLEKDS